MVVIVSGILTVKVERINDMIVVMTMWVSIVAKGPKIIQCISILFQLFFAELIEKNSISLSITCCLEFTTSKSSNETKQLYRLYIIAFQTWRLLNLDFWPTHKWHREKWQKWFGLQPCGSRSDI